MCVSELWVHHQPRHGPAKARSAVVLDRIGKGLAKVECPLLGLALLGKVVAVEDGLGKGVAVEIVHGTARADEEAALTAEMAEGNADLQMLMRIKVHVGADDDQWKALSPREHPLDCGGRV